MEGLLDQLRDRLKKAKSSLRIASPWIEGEVLEKLLSYTPKGIKIEALIRAYEPKDLEITDEYTFKVLRRFGADIYLSHKIHAKMLIVDGEIALVGSANLTRRGTQEDGNLEAVVLVEDKEKVRELVSLFEGFKGLSFRLPADAVAVAVSLESATSATVLLLEELKEQTLLKAELEDSTLLCKLVRIFTTPLDLPKLRYAESKDWLIAYVNTLTTGKMFKLGRVNVVLELSQEEREGKGLFSTPLKTIKIGQPFSLVGEDNQLDRVIKSNSTGYSMDTPVRVGRLLGTNTPVYVDLVKVSSMHMAVLGTTGSGKTTFVRRFLENLPPNTTKVFVFDLFDEYGEGLQVNKERLLKVELPDTLLLANAEDVKDLLRDYGFVLQEKSMQERDFFAGIRRLLKPDINLSALKLMGLGEVLLRHAKGEVKSHIEELMALLVRDYGEEVLTNQPLVIDLFEKALNSKEDIVVFNLKNITNLNARLNAVGLLLKEVLHLSKEKRQKSLVVLEEAHNFVPEKGAVDVPAGRENLATIITRRIALEGRKFGVGLIAVSQ
ncbi:MAG: DUF87 domain-containing protein, partial [Aquificota bacterium]